MTGDRRAYFRTYRRQRKETGDGREVRPSFTAAQYRTLEQRAADAGLAPAAYLRALFLSHCRGERVLPKSVADELRSLTLELRRIGNNVNQIAHAFNAENASGRVGRFDPDHAHELMGELEDRIRAALTRYDGGGLP